MQAPTFHHTPPPCLNGAARAQQPLLVSALALEFELELALALAVAVAVAVLARHAACASLSSTLRGRGTRRWSTT
jgi:hypothetical protein